MLLGLTLLPLTWKSVSYSTGCPLANSFADENWASDPRTGIKGGCHQAGLTQVWARTQEMAYMLDIHSQSKLRS